MSPHNGDQRYQPNLQPVHSKEEVAQYPPNILRSQDGEEGYAESQRALRSFTWDTDGEGKAYGPPPNRTISDGESPPSYRSQSVSLLDRSINSSKSAAATRIVRDASGGTVVMPCYTMSSNNNNDHRNCNLNDTAVSTTTTGTQGPGLVPVALGCGGPGGGVGAAGSHPYHNLTVYGHPPRTCLAHQENHLHQKQQQQLKQKPQSLPQLYHQHNIQQQQQQQQHHGAGGVYRTRTRPSDHHHLPTTRHSGSYSGEAAVYVPAATPTTTTTTTTPTSPALGPPPNYSDVVTNSNNVFTHHADSDV